LQKIDSTPQEYIFYGTKATKTLGESQKGEDPQIRHDGESNRHGPNGHHGFLAVSDTEFAESTVFRVQQTRFYQVDDSKEHQKNQDGD